jgi:hypothetical protein
VSEVAGAAEVVPSECNATLVGLVLLSIPPMAEWSNYEEDERVAGFFQAYYGLAASHLASVGGRVVDSLADVIVAVYPWRSSANVVPLLPALSERVTQAAAAFRLDASLNMNVHLGIVIEGSFGVPGQERPGIVGKALEVTMRLPRGGLVITGEVFEDLPKQWQARFARIPCPITLCSVYRLHGES